jgi:uncharacterized protein (DUF433 family)
MKQKRPDIYGGQDPRDLARYGVTEAAWYLKIPPTTLRPWVAGREYRDRIKPFRPLMKTPERNPPQLSFHNLVEAYILRSLRREHRVSIEAVRQAIDFAQKECGVERLLLSPELSTAAGELLLDKYGELINLNRSGQLIMKKLFEAHIKRITWDQANTPSHLYPFITGTVDDPRDEQKIIVIDARRAFGRPIISRRGISTSVIVERIDAGELEEDVAADYDLRKEELDAAMLYEYPQAA